MQGFHYLNVQMHVACDPSVGVRDRYERPCQIYTLPSQRELLHLPQASEDGQPDPCTMGRNTLSANQSLFFHTQTLHPSRRFFQELHLRHRRGIQGAIPHRVVQNMTQRVGPEISRDRPSDGRGLWCVALLG